MLFAFFVIDRYCSRFGFGLSAITRKPTYYLELWSTLDYLQFTTVNLTTDYVMFSVR